MFAIGLLYKKKFHTSVNKLFWMFSMLEIRFTSDLETFSLPGYKGSS